jgi:hypothetical protein
MYASSDIAVDQARVTANGEHVSSTAFIAARALKIPIA